MMSGPQTLPSSSQQKPAPPPPQEYYGNVLPVMEPAAVVREPASGQPYNRPLPSVSGRPVNQYAEAVPSEQPVNPFSGPVNQYDGPQVPGQAVNHYQPNPSPGALNTGRPAFNTGQPVINTGHTVFDPRTGASPGPIPGPIVRQPVKANMAMVAMAGGQEAIQSQTTGPPAPQAPIRPPVRANPNIPQQAYRPDIRPPVRVEPDVPSFSTGEELKSDHGTALTHLIILLLSTCPALQLVSWPTH